jgi:hypothetical protein
MLEQHNGNLTDSLEFGLEILLVPTVGDVKKEIRVFTLKKLCRWDSSADSQH